MRVDVTIRAMFLTVAVLAVSAPVAAAQPSAVEEYRESLPSADRERDDPGKRPERKASGQNRGEGDRDRDRDGTQGSVAPGGGSGNDDDDSGRGAGVLRAVRDVLEGTSADPLAGRIVDPEEAAAGGSSSADPASSSSSDSNRTGLLLLALAMATIGALGVAAVLKRRRSPPEIDPST